MIHYLVTRAHRYTMQEYLETWNRPAYSRVQVAHYEDMPGWRQVEGGTYIFSDVERLTAGQAQIAKGFHDQVAAAGARVLNDPATVIRRYDLLRLMHERGINPFRAYRLDEPRERMKFPVFLRQENEHHGAMTPLLNDETELQTAIVEARRGPVDPRDIIIVEYCDTASPDGMFRKYAAMKIGDDLIARHILYSRDWCNKYPTLSDEAKVAEEAEFVRTNPHEQQLREIFAAANVNYGRIDYSIRDGKVVVWEINTNPVVIVSPGTCAPDRLPAQSRSAARVGEAFQKIDTTTESAPIRVRFEKELLSAVGWGPKQQVRSQLLHHGKKIARAGRTWFGRH